MPAPEPAKESEGTSGPDVIGSISGTRLTVRPSLLGRAVGGLGTSILAGALLGGSAWLSDQPTVQPARPRPTPSAPGWRRVRARASGPRSRPARCAARRPADRGRRVLPVVRDARRRVSGDRGGHAATVWGLVALFAGLGDGRRGRHLARDRLAEGVRRRGPLRRAPGRGIMFGLGRLVHVEQLWADPGALLFGLRDPAGAAARPAPACGRAPARYSRRSRSASSACSRSGRSPRRSGPPTASTGSGRKQPRAVELC